MIRRPLRILGPTLLAVAASALSGCAGAMPQNPFDAAGTVSKMQMDLLKLSLWFAIGIGTFVTLALLYVVFRYRQKPGDNPKAVPEQIHGNHTLEIAWTLIPIIILAIVAVPTVKTAFATKSSKDPNAVQVKVIGHQWWFEFQYPEHGIITANELVIPVGKDVSAEITSADVIHSFWIPKLAGKMDLIPGRLNHMWFNAERPELFYGQCAEFCGTAHANMRFRVRAVSQQEFDAWIAAHKQAPPIPTAGKELQGYELVMGKTPAKANCISCHTINGTKAQAKVGPNLSNVGERATIAAGLVDNTEEHLKQWVRNPQSIKPGVTMPAHP
ncbi:MAG TPA: cytochrome c oxidase subunit II, partial [Symbiobacteriaceae bacterium]|nr:cytochrome c oxidase subunit II [Symbiobacteriaceae bacterium]